MVEFLGALWQSLHTKEDNQGPSKDTQDIYTHQFKEALHTLTKNKHKGPSSGAATVPLPLCLADREEGGQPKKRVEGEPLLVSTALGGHERGNRGIGEPGIPELGAQ